MFFCFLIANTSSTIKYSYNKTVKNRSGPVLSNVSFISTAYILVIKSSYLFFMLAAFFSNTVLMRFWPIRL
jgi:hypothetical protein